MAILVTGGAGYIGSAMVERLVGSGASVVVLDDLRRGYRAAVSASLPFYQSRAGNKLRNRSQP